MKYRLKFFPFLFFLILGGFAVKAQQKHFIYVQSEDKQPFAIVMNGKVFSSSDYGYIIIPKLADSTYKFTVSFPLNKHPDQFFTCTINKQDVGYTLKNTSGEWVLQNLQTQKLVKNNDVAQNTSTSFSDMLSDVVDDSTLTKNAVVQEPVDTTKKTGESVAASNSDMATGMIEAPRKISQQQLDSGVNLFFVDKTKNGYDTIDVFVPNETGEKGVQNKIATLPVTSLEDTGNMAEDTSVINNNSAVAENKEVETELVSSNANDSSEKDSHAVSNPFYKPEEKTGNEVAEINSEEQQTQTLNESNAVKQDCGNMITDEQFSKLKRKMFIQGSNNDMIQYALKYLGTKCITTSQVKELGALFSSDDGRYSLFDALYNSTYDYGHYPELGSQIVDPYYKKRFEAMLR